VLSVVQHFQEEPSAYWTLLQRLLSYQGFVLLPILGIGPFILPRFFGMQSAHDFPESLSPSAGWLRKALGALLAGALIIASFFIEASGYLRLAYALRCVTTLAYLLAEFPFRRAPKAETSLGASIRIAFAGLVGGFLFIALFPGYQVGLLHLTLVGGFSVMTFVVLFQTLDEFLKGIPGFDHGSHDRPAADVHHRPHVLPGFRPADFRLDGQNVVKQPVDGADLVIAHPGVLCGNLEGRRPTFLAQLHQLFAEDLLLVQPHPLPNEQTHAAHISSSMFNVQG
jgi:hypothetical protein